MPIIFRLIDSIIPLAWGRLKKRRLILAFFITTSQLYTASGIAQAQHSFSERITSITNDQTLDTTKLLEDISILGQLMQTNPDSAFLQYKEVWKNSNRMHYDHGQILALSGMGSCKTILGDYQEARVLYQQGLKYYFRKSDGNPKVIFALYSGLGHLYNLSGRYDSAAYYLHEGLNELLRNPSKDYRFIAKFYLNLTTYWFNLSDIGKASFYLEKGISLALMEKDSPLLSDLFYNKAIIYHKKQQADSARYYFKMSSKANPGSNDISTANRVNNQGIMLSTVKRYQEAIKYQKKALQIRKTINDRRGIIQSYRSLAGTSLLMKDYKNALSFLEQALSYFNKDTLNQDYLRLIGLKAQLYAKMGNYQDAYKIFTEQSVPLLSSIYSMEVFKNMNELDVKYKSIEKDNQIAKSQLQINQQQNRLREKNLWIGGISASSLLLLAFLGSAYRSNKRKKSLHEKQLQLLQQEQRIDQLRAVMQGEEQERSRLARELHDGIGGMLAFIRMDLSVAKSEYQVITDTSRLDKLMYMVQDTSAEVRKAAHNLMPDALTRHSLVEALVIYCDNINKGQAPEIEVQLRGNLDQLDKSTELMLYRMVQELIQNILKHAHAHHVLLQLIEDRGKIRMFVEDDGVGFDVDQAEGGYGLQNLHYRVRALQGELSITSEPLRGTTVYIEFDLNILLKKNSI